MATTETKASLPFELRIPGTWVIVGGQPAPMEVASVLSSIRQAFSEAVMALLLFESRPQAPTPPPISEILPAMRARESELENGVEHALGDRLDPFNFAQRQEISLRVDELYLRERFAAGHIPEAFTGVFHVLCGKSFLLAIASIGAMLDVLAQNDTLPYRARSIKNRFAKAFPNLIQVRDSVAHIEDRARGMKDKNVPIDLGPVGPSKSGSPFPDGALVLQCFAGTTFTMTLANGKLGEIDVNSGTIEVVRNHIQDLYDAFEWSGPPVHFPSGRRWLR